MSGGIKDIAVSHQRLIDTVNRKHEREVKQMNEIHSDNVGQIRKSHSVDLVSLQDQHDSQITTENERKERVLRQMKGNLDETKQLTEKEIKELADFKQKETHDIQGKFTNDRERIAGEHNENLESMVDRYNQASRKINLDGQERVKADTEQMNDLYSDRSSFNQKRIDKQHNEFVGRFKKDDEKYQKIKNTQDTTFKKERMTTHKKHETDIATATKLHSEEVEKRDTLKRGDLKDQEVFFEKRYSDTYKRHNEHFKTLDQIHDKVVKGLEADLTKKVDFKASRVEDPFFQFVELKPTVEQTETGIRIKVNVPDHSKQDLQLNLNGKEAVVNFNRRYIDTQKDDLGNSSRVSKIETLSTRLQTGIHLDPKSVKSSYQNGVMTYEIKKA